MSHSSRTTRHTCPFAIPWTIWVAVGWCKRLGVVFSAWQCRLQLTEKGGVGKHARILHKTKWLANRCCQSNLCLSTSCWYIQFIPSAGHSFSPSLPLGILSARKTSGNLQPSKNCNPPKIRVYGIRLSPYIYIYMYIYIYIYNIIYIYIYIYIYRERERVQIAANAHHTIQKVYKNKHKPTHLSQYPAPCATS